MSPTGPQADRSSDESNAERGDSAAEDTDDPGNLDLTGGRSEGSAGVDVVASSSPNDGNGALAPDDEGDTDSSSRDVSQDETTDEVQIDSSLQDLALTPGATVLAPQPLPTPGDVPPQDTVDDRVPTQSSPQRPWVPRSQRPRPQIGQGRVVRERLRHIDPRSVLKLAAVFYFCIVLVVMVASVLLWQFARSTGVVDDVESFVTQLFTYGDCVSEDELELGQDFRTDDQCPDGQVMVGGFEIDNGAVMRSVFFGGTIVAVVATVGTVLTVLLFNLLSDVTGGVRYDVVREPQDSVSRSGGSTRARPQR